MEGLYKIYKGMVEGCMQASVRLSLGPQFGILVKPLQPHFEAPSK